MTIFLLSFILSQWIATNIETHIDSYVVEMIHAARMFEEQEQKHKIRIRLRGNKNRRCRKDTPQK